MNGGSIARLIIPLCVGGLIFLFVIGIVFGGKKTVQQANYDVQVTQSTAAAEGLDLQAVGQLVQNAKDAEELEKMINVPEINNIDLNEDGTIDYIQVHEYGEGDNRGFSLVTEFEAGEEQELATIDISKTGSDEVDVEVHGNEHVYGRGHYHHSRFGLGDALLLSWVFSSHRPFMSPYGYGAYPGYYRPYSRMPVTQYRSGLRGAAASSSFTQGTQSKVANKAVSPKAGKNSSKIKAPLRNPTSSQKQFQARSKTKTTGSGGFGKKTNSTSKQKVSVRSSRSSRSGTRSGGK